jgi:pectinesterase
VIIYDHEYFSKVHNIPRFYSSFAPPFDLKMQRSPFVFVITLFMTIFVGVSQAVNCIRGTGGSKVARTIVVDPSGKGNFKTIQGAIDSIPENNNNWIKVQVNAGIYM